MELHWQLNPLAIACQTTVGLAVGLAVLGPVPRAVAASARVALLTSPAEAHSELQSHRVETAAAEQAAAEQAAAEQAAAEQAVTKHSCEVQPQGTILSDAATSLAALGSDSPLAQASVLVAGLGCLVGGSLWLKRHAPHLSLDTAVEYDR